jgi:hypothetical protein
VQMGCIPAILQGRNVIGTAQTGSGKTAAFALPILQHLAKDPFGVFCLVLTPTRWVLGACLAAAAAAAAAAATSIEQQQQQQQVWGCTCVSKSKSECASTHTNSWTRLLLSWCISRCCRCVCERAGSWQCSWQISSGPLGRA